MKRIMFIGKSGCGKTTLLQSLRGQRGRYAKTQALCFYNEAIDTPGEYLEQKNFIHALQVTAVGADAIFLLHASVDRYNSFFPGMQSVFNRPCFGIVTKADLAQGEDDYARAERFLRMAGASEVFCISAKTGFGMEPLRTFLWEAFGLFPGAAPTLLKERTNESVY